MYREAEVPIPAPLPPRKFHVIMSNCIVAINQGKKVLFILKHNFSRISQVTLYEVTVNEELAEPRKLFKRFNSFVTLHEDLEAAIARKRLSIEVAEFFF